MDLTFPLPKVFAYARANLGVEAEAWELRLSRPDAGYVSEAPYRWDLVFLLPDGDLQTISVVQKQYLPFAAEQELMLTRFPTQLLKRAV